MASRIRMIVLALSVGFLMPATFLQACGYSGCGDSDMWDYGSYSDMSWGGSCGGYYDGCASPYDYSNFSISYSDSYFTPMCGGTCSNYGSSSMPTFWSMNPYSNYSPIYSNPMTDPMNPYSMPVNPFISPYTDPIIQISVNTPNPYSNPYSNPVGPNPFLPTYPYNPVPMNPVFPMIPPGPMFPPPLYVPGPMVGNPPMTFPAPYPVATLPPTTAVPPNRISIPRGSHTFGFAK